MADLTGASDTLPVRIGGVNSLTGLPDNYADVNVGGSLQVAGQGVAGTPAGGVVSIQGVASGTAVPVSAASLPLPTGASTSANQTTEITSLQLIDNPVGSVVAGTAGTSSYLTGGVFNTALPTLTTGQQAAIQLDSSGRQIIAPLTSTSIVTVDQGTANTHANAWFARLTDGTDDSQITSTGDLQVADIVNTAGQFRAQSVTTTAAEALGATTILANRKFISITPTNGVLYWGFANTVTSTNGTPIQKGQTMVFAVGSNVHIFLIGMATTDCRIAEGS